MRAAVREGFSVDVTANLELVKLVAFALMLVDHWFAYVLHVPSELANHAGALVLPLFSLAFGYGWARSRKRDPFGVLLRLLFWACVAQAFAAFARPFMPLNIIYSFAGGFALFLAVTERDLTGFERSVFVVFPLLFGVFTEFLHAGIAVVFFALMWAREPREWVAFGGVVSVLALAPFNESWAALVAVPLFFLLGACPWIVPRVPRLFYAGYALQFGVLALIGAIMRGGLDGV